MRVYIPLTLPALAAAHASGMVAGAGAPAHAVTPAIREWYVEGDLEELEFVAMTEAAESSLRLLARDGAAPRRRVVVAAEVPDGSLAPAGPDGRRRSQVRLTADVPLKGVVSVHLDEDAAAGAVAAAIQALPAADAGDDDAQFLLDEAQAHDLLWYDVTELPHLV